MKKITLIALLAISGIAQSATLTCLREKAWETQGMGVTANISGDFEVLGENQVEFSEITFEYAIDEGEDYSWSEGKQTFENLVNYAKYNPRKYKGHMKFNAYVDGSNGQQGYYSGGFGDLDLIVPTDKMINAEPAKFTGYLIMTYMDDHFGGTIQLDCEIK